ncbi:MAG: hypothetical protein M1358_01035 [Chloroflexi bacterium]|nr:hypothetical protein [Chloroflexota bacterium]
MRDLKVEMIRLDHLFDHYDVYQRDASGNVTYHWEKLDQMVDSVLAMGAKPLMSLSYMPLAISADGSEKSPPADFAAWRNLVYEAVKHFNLDRKLGIVYWEIWNEPNLSSTWHSDLETYLQLYDAAAQAIRAADPAAKVGGPGVAGFEERWIYTLISHVAEKGLPFDFLSWHLYGVQPPMIKPQVLLARSWLSRFPQLGDTQLFLDEWSVYNGGVDDTSWNGISDTEYAAAYIAAMTSELTRQGLDGSMLFAVKDAHTNDDRTFSGRWGVLSNSGAPKASYNALKALSLLGDTELSVTGGGSHVGAVATRQGDKVAVLLWNLGNPFQAEGSQEIELSLEGLAGQQAFQRYLIDATHSNGRYSIDHAELELVESGAASAGTHQQKLSLPDNSVTLLLFSPQ